jgi:hypothetical protein
MSSTLPLPNAVPPVVAAFPALGRFGFGHFPVERRARPRPPSQFVDPETGLLNRAGLVDAVTTMLESSVTPPGSGALLCVDLGGPEVLAAIAATAGLGGRDGVLRAAAAALCAAIVGTLRRRDVRGACGGAGRHPVNTGGRMRAGAPEA